MSGLNIANITRMAKEADLWGDIYAIQRFAELVAAAEREACAKVCDELILEHPGRADMTAQQCAEAIRARGQE